MRSEPCEFFACLVSTLCIVLPHQQFDSRTGNGGTRRRVSLLRWVVGIGVLVVVGSLALALATGRMRPFKVISRSMAPTLEIGDCVLMSEVPESAILRGKIVAFIAPDNPAETLTKRVVGVGGDVVRLRDGKLTVNDAPEPVRHESIVNVSDRVWTLREDECFVVGDNRNDSNDSIDFGPVIRPEIRGVLSYRYWPLSRMGRIE
jgi:signal peptidase I